jgi:hypothetical protein
MAALHQKGRERGCIIALDLDLILGRGGENLIQGMIEGFGDDYFSIRPSDKRA